MWPKNIEIGPDCTIQDKVRFYVSHPFSYDNRIEIGKCVFLGQNCDFNCASKIKVGDNTLIAANTMIVDVGHATASETLINKQPVVSGAILIGNDVWIGAGCIILKGITIGNGSVIGAGSLVNKSVPAYQVWAGTPARFIKNRD